MIDLGDWKEPLAPLFADERYKKIRAFLIEEYRRHIVYPEDRKSTRLNSSHL